MRNVILEKPDEMDDTQFADYVRRAGGPKNANFRSSGRLRAVRVQESSFDFNLFKVDEGTEAQVLATVSGW